MWTVEELALYNGTDERLPILLGILGYSLIAILCWIFLECGFGLCFVKRFIIIIIIIFVCRSVFDVTKGKTHYGPGGGYHHFAGRCVNSFYIYNDINPC